MARRLRQVAVTLVLIPVFLAVSLIPILPKPAHAASQAPPAPMPEDEMGQAAQQDTSEIDLSVDVRDGHLTARVVDIWGPGRKPFIIRSLTNAPMKSQTAANPGWEWNLLSDVTFSQDGKWLVREPDGNRGSYAGTIPSETGTSLYEKTIGSYSTTDVHWTCVGPVGDRECTADLWTVHASKGVNLKYEPNPKINQTGQPDGLLREIRDANGNATTATWISFGDALQSNYIEKLTDSVGRVTTFTYERGEVAGCIDVGQLQAKGIKVSPYSVTASGCVNYYYYRIQKVTDPYGRSATYTYNASRLLSSALNAAGYTTSYTYGDPLGPLLTAVTNARGHRTTIEWVSLEIDLGRVRRVVSPDGTATEYVYDLANRKTTVTDGGGNASVYQYNAINKITETGGDILSVTDPLGNIARYEYDGRHNVTKETDARGIPTVYTYNSRNRTTKIVRASGSLNITTSMTWDANGNMLSATNPRGVRTEYTYDTKHNLIKIVKAVGTADEITMNYTYNSWGGVATASNPRNSAWKWTFAYNARHLLQSITPPAGGMTALTYNAYEDHNTKADGNGHVWTTTFTPSRQVLSITDPTGNKVINSYDANGNRTTTKDAKNLTTTFTYDSRNRLVSIRNPLNGVTTYEYDNVGRVSRIVDARNVTVATFAYDADSQVTQVLDGLNQAINYTYDANGSRRTMRDRRGTTHTYTYDNVGRLTQVSAGGTTFSYAYDANGNRISLTDGTGTTTHDYDNLDRLIKTIYPDGKTVQYAYDDASNRTKLTNPLGTQTTYGYDAANRVSTITQGSLSWSFTYDDASNRSSITMPNGTQTVYSYLDNNWLSSVVHKKTGGGTLQSFAYSYDANGNRISQADSTGTTSFGYDAMNRLISAAYPGGYGNWTWSYDPVGNRLSQTSPAGTINYTIDANNRLISAGGIIYSYDANGNLVSTSAGQTFSYDVHNRMTQSVGPGGTATFTYNGDGLTIRRIGPDGTTRYYHDGLLQIWEADGAGSMVAQLDRDPFGNLLSRKEPSGTRRHYHHDGVGSVTALTDESGNAVATLLYDAWGSQRSATGSQPGKYRFAGAELDEASGFYHIGARFYDPSIGRWLSEDPAGSNVFEPLTLNAYAYSFNSPISLSDRTGLFPTPTVIGIAVHNRVEWYFRVIRFPQRNAWTEHRIEGFQLRLDMMLEVNGKLEVYELKPASWLSGRRLEQSRQQVLSYVKALRARGYDARLGTYWQPRKEKVPFNRIFYIELTYAEPGLIGYRLVQNPNAAQVLIEQYGVDPSIVEDVLKLLAIAWGAGVAPPSEEQPVPAYAP